MVRRDLRFLMLWVLALLLIMVVLRHHVVEYAWRRSEIAVAQKRLDYQVEISEAELIDFIRLWPKYKKLNLGETDDVSVKIENDYSWKNFLSSIWFLYHKWDPERFYYVRERVLYVLQTLDSQRYSQAVIQALVHQKDKTAREMVKLQRQHLKAEQLGAEETALISKYKEDLKELLK